jgi:hypothetical protein
MSSNLQNNQTKRKNIRKPGCTLLLRFLTEPDTSVFTNLNGLISSNETKTPNSYFLVFDTPQNALSTYKTLRLDTTNYFVKYVYYKIFFKINGLDDSVDYNQLKTEFTNYISSLTSSNVLYCKFYRKNNSYVGCGDFTLDKLSGLNILLSKETGLREFSFGSYSGSFYYFNKNKTTDTLEDTN